MNQLSLFNENKAKTVKAVSLWQPWAWMVDAKLKRHETRSWYTSYRGLLVICSAKKNTNELKNFYSSWVFSFPYASEKHVDPNINIPSWKDMRFGEAICLVNLVDCIKMTEVLISQQSQIELNCGDWKPDRYAWKLEHIKTINNVPIKGHQGLFDIPRDF